MTFTIKQLADDPKEFTRLIQFMDYDFCLRPLVSTDNDQLTNLINNLSFETKGFYSLTDGGEKVAKDYCEAIGKYDKLRFVLEDKVTNMIVGLFEFSFDIPENDKDRFSGYGVDLLSVTDCRFGPLLLDEYQGIGIGSKILPIMVDFAKKFEQKRIILWGGVHTNNPQAIKFYEKNGFKKFGKFINKDSLECLDMILEIKLT